MNSLKTSLALLSFFCCIASETTDANAASNNNHNNNNNNNNNKDDYYHLATINFGHLQSTHPYIRQKAEKQLLNAMENIGFIVLTNHGISHETMDLMWNDTANFFDSPFDNKNSVPMTPDYMYGYSATEILSRSETESGHGYENDNKETFQVWIGAKDTGRDLNVLWPEYPNNMKESWTNYYRECENVASQLLSSMAYVLELPRDWFEDKLTDHMSALRALNYPENGQSNNNNNGNNNGERSLRCSPHSDYGTLTLLRQDGVGGLQVEKNNEWLDVISDQYDFIVNLGDLMQRWTNDRFKSTRHRVVNPRDNPKIANRRQSVAFFHNLNEDALVETIPSCLDENGESKYKAIKFRDFLESKHHATQTHYDASKNEL